MKNLSVSLAVLRKLLERHSVVLREVNECFKNRTGGYLEDVRPNSATVPPTWWFIAETNRGRTLKIVFIEFSDEIVLKTAFEPNLVEIQIYAKYS